MKLASYPQDRKSSDTEGFQVMGIQDLRAMGAEYPRFAIISMTTAEVFWVLLATWYKDPRLQHWISSMQLLPHHNQALSRTIHQNI